MTVKEYLEKARKAGEHLTPVGHGKSYAEAIAETMDVWSNDAAFGYVIEAMKRVGCRRDTINKTLTAMYYVMDELGVDEAAERYRNY